MQTQSTNWLIVAIVIASTIFIFALLYALSPMLSPFLTAILLAYMGDPLVDKLEDRGVNRTLSVTIGFSVLTLVLVILGLILVPMLVRQTGELIDSIPEMINWLHLVALPAIEIRTGFEVTSLTVGDIQSQMDWLKTGNIFKNIMIKVSSSGLAFAALLGNLFLIPVVTFYLLRDWDLLVEKIGRLIPRKYYGSCHSVVKECHETLGAFLKGQLIVMLALAIIYSTGLSLIGLKLGLIIGLIAGLASIVPYMGIVVGIVIASIAAFFQFQDWQHIGLVLLVFIVGQALEGTLLTPLLVGDKIGLHPVAVIFAVLAGGQLFGFVGILLALPVAAIIMVLLRRMHKNYKESEFYDVPKNNNEEG